MSFNIVMLCLVGIRVAESGVPEDEENFDEALKAVNTALGEAEVTKSLEELLNHPLTTNLNSTVSHLI